MTRGLIPNNFMNCTLKKIFKFCVRFATRRPLQKSYDQRSRARGCSRYLLLAAAGLVAPAHALLPNIDPIPVEVLRPIEPHTGLSLVTPARPHRGEFYQFRKSWRMSVEFLAQYSMWNVMILFSSQSQLSFFEHFLTRGVGEIFRDL